MLQITINDLLHAQLYKILLELKCMHQTARHDFKGRKKKYVILNCYQEIMFY